MMRTSLESFFVLILAFFGVGFAIFVKQQETPLNSAGDLERMRSGEKQPMMPFPAYVLGQSPISQGDAYRGRNAGNAPVPAADYKQAVLNETAESVLYVLANTTEETIIPVKYHESEYYEPNHCEVLLVEEITRATKQIIESTLAGKYGRLRKYRHAVQVAAVVPEFTAEALHNNLDVMDTITKALEEEYKTIPFTSAEEKGNLTKLFTDRIKLAATDISTGICKFSYCCLNTQNVVNTNFEYSPTSTLNG